MKNLRVWDNAGAPVNGTNEVNTLTFSGTITAGTFKLSYRGIKTAAITWSAVNATLVANIQTALNAHRRIGSGGATAAVGTMTAGIGTITITGAAGLAKADLATMIVTDKALTGSGANVALTNTTPGVTATERKAAKNDLLLDTENSVLYINTSGTSLAPAWERVGPAE